MNTYKVIFARNEIISCEIADRGLTDNARHYEHDKGQLIFALIRAETQPDAIKEAEELVKEVKENTFGKDFVT